MLRQFITAVSLASVMLVPSVTSAKPKNAFSSEQKQAIENIVREYLIENPTLMLEVGEALEKQQREQMQKQVQTAIKQYASDLFNSDSPYFGNKNGKVTLVEFFDYQCKYCKTMTPVVHSIVKNNDNVKVILKELPIFGADSEFASKAALASRYQNKYEDFHNALFNANGRLNQSVVLKIAKDSGIDVDQLQKDMKRPEVEKELENNEKLQRVLRLVGTPAFILVKTPFDDSEEALFIPGAVGEDDLQEKIKSLSNG